MQLPPDIDQWLKAFSAIGAVVVFAWGVIQFVATQRAQSKTRRIEATKPFLERQLHLYTQATQVAAVLATETRAAEREQAAKTFWRLYWGELALVENQRVEAAMVEFGGILKAGGAGHEIEVASLKLAHACRESLAESWGVEQWRKPPVRWQSAA
jgi:hypothetical protein